MYSFGNLLFVLIQQGDVMFHGDTLDVHVSLAAILTPIALISLVLIVFAIRKDLGLPGGTVGLNKRNNRAA